MMKLAKGELVSIVWYLEYDITTKQFTAHKAEPHKDGFAINAEIVQRTDGIFEGYLIYLARLLNTDRLVFITEQSRKMTPYHMTRYGEAWLSRGAERELLVLDEDYWKDFRKFDAEERGRWANWDETEHIADDYDLVIPPHIDLIDLYLCPSEYKYG